MKACILRSDLELPVQRWITSCNKFGIKYEVVNLLSNDWQERIFNSKCNFYLACPPGFQEHLKRVYDEKIFLIERTMNKRVFPSFNEISIYENKRFFSYFAQTHNIPTPRTNVYYLKEEALESLQTTVFPLVAKTSIGAGGSGVRILQSIKQATEYINDAFTKGIKRKNGPSIVGRSKISLIKKAINDPKYLLERLHFYRTFNDYPQKGYVIFQEYIPHDFEWRIIKIGESLFGHKKVKIGEMASGTKLKQYDAPPLSLLDMVDTLCNRLGFDIMAVDLLEHDGKYYVNEMQTNWGQKFDFLMEINGKKGCFVKKEGTWTFEEGDFNQNASFDLKLQHILSVLQNG